MQTPKLHEFTMHLFLVRRILDVQVAWFAHKHALQVWQMLPSMPTARKNLAATAVGGFLYVTGPYCQPRNESSVVLNLQHFGAAMSTADECSPFRC